MKDLKTFLQELLSRLKQFDEINKKKSSRVQEQQKNCLFSHSSCGDIERRFFHKDKKIRNKMRKNDCECRSHAIVCN